MKYEKFEGSLGEFLEQFLNGVKFYTNNHKEIANWQDDIRYLRTYYNQGVYTEKEEVWTDHLPVLCWVSADKTSSRHLRVIERVTEYLSFRATDYSYWKYARPVTQAEIDKMIWKGGE